MHVRLLFLLRREKAVFRIRDLVRVRKCITDPDPGSALFFSDFQDANKN
jgi:hypothetical protein